MQWKIMGRLYVNNKRGQTEKSKCAKTEEKHNLNHDRHTMIDLTGLQWATSLAYAKNIDPQQVQMVVNSDVDASGYKPTNEGKYYIINTCGEGGRVSKLRRALRAPFSSRNIIFKPFVNICQFWQHTPANICPFGSVTNLPWP